MLAPGAPSVYSLIEDDPQSGVGPLTFYHIRHLTRFRYSTPISESVMEVRMQPRTEGPQRSLDFKLTVTPRARVSFFRDYLGNTVHGFDIPAQHSRMVITAEAQVEMRKFEPIPDALDSGAWEQLDRLINDNDYWDMLMPSFFAKPTTRLLALASDLKVERRGDPLSLLREVNTALYRALSYKPQTTDVDSSIDEALETRAGVCQDYAHIMIALVRELRIPCRYVSGYLFHHRGGNGRADRSAQDATHAWVEALLPDIGWVGFDPTNNLIAAERHIRVAIGRDYADVPPTRGMFRGGADTELTVAVNVTTMDEPPDIDLPPEPTTTGEFPVLNLDDDLQRDQEQQQQQ